MELNQLTFLTKASAACVAALAISSCDSGGSAGGSAPATKPAAPTSFALSAEGIANFRFTWDTVSNVTHYQLFVNPDGSSGFSEIGNKIDGSLTSFDLSVPLYDQANASYMLSACNAVGCSDSSTVFPAAAAALVDGIGYIKGLEADDGSKFGEHVSLSDDGNRMAVGAPNYTPATGEANAGGVFVFVKDGNTWKQEYLATSPTPDSTDYFGTSVSLNSDGSTMAVGVPDEDSTAKGINVIGGTDANAFDNIGAAYVYTRDGSDWSREAYIKPAGNPDNGSAFDSVQFFGKSVSLSNDGNTLAVGASNNSVDPTFQEGAAYIFSRSGSTWTELSVLVAADADGADFFGTSISLSGDGSTVAIGARGEDDPGSSQNEGAVYVFTKNATGWTQEEKIKASNASADDNFGASVSLSKNGNELAIGAVDEDSSTPGVSPRGDDPSVSDLSGNSGAVYMLKRTGTSWNEVAFIKASNLRTGDNFGTSVSISDDGLYLAVGATGQDGSAENFNADPNQFSAGGSNSGAVYVFKNDGTTWSQTSYVKATNRGSGDAFGNSVSINNRGSLLVGAPLEDSNATTVGGDQQDNTANASGAAYLY